MGSEHPQRDHRSELPLRIHDSATMQPSNRLLPDEVIETGERKDGAPFVRAIALMMDEKQRTAYDPANVLAIWSSPRTNACPIGPKQKVVGHDRRSRGSGRRGISIAKLCG